MSSRSSDSVVVLFLRTFVERMQFHDLIGETWLESRA